MASVTWWQTLATQQAAGTLFATYTTAKTVINAQALYTLPAGTLKIGDQLRVQVAGGISNLVTTPGTITMQVMFGTIVVFTTGALQLSTTAHTTIPFWLDVLLTCRAIGATTSANFMGQAVIHSQTVNATAIADGTQTHTTLLGPNTAPAVGTGFDSTVANIIDFWTGFSISNAANGVQVQQYNVSLLT